MLATDGKSEMSRMGLNRLLHDVVYLHESSGVELELPAEEVVPPAELLVPPAEGLAPLAELLPVEDECSSSTVGSLFGAPIGSQNVRSPARMASFLCLLSAALRRH